MSRRWVWLVIGTLALFLASDDTFARTARAISGAELASPIKLSESRIILGSDSVVLNQRLLKRGEEYTIDGFPPVLRIKDYRPSANDTLRIWFEPWPVWLKVDWGRPLPSPENPVSPLPSPVSAGTNAVAQPWSNVRLSGNKTFRVVSGSTGGSSFGQSLDLGISGELAPGVELTGAVSDRGYDPIYGVANSRIDEFDRLYLRLKSNHLLAQVGDVTVGSTRGPARGRDMSGGTALVRLPTWSVSGTAARPRGRFESAHLSGSDGFQGPYQPGNGVAAIVPNSERVWLDGILMERGANKDYTIDYPTGRITFTALHPIDNRSRIEIDYEPLATQYRQEYIAGTGGLSSRDSSRRLNVAISRDGDDKGQSLLSLSSDDIAALGQTNDSVIARSGVTADSLGSYRLNADSLPDTVWQYVGPGKGDHTVKFSFVGTGKGSYRYLGSDYFQFVGPAHGDYLPVILLVAPRRVETAKISGTVASRSLGTIDADVRLSRASRNLWSSNAATDAGYHRLTFQKSWQANGATNQFSATRQYLQNGFVSDQRLDDPDLAREFLVPALLTPDRTRLRHDIGGRISPVKGIILSPQVSNLDYSNAFKSTFAGMGCEAQVSSRLLLTTSWHSVWSTYSLSPAGGAGRVSSGLITGAYTNGQTGLRSETELDDRHNEYGTSPSGTRFARSSLELSHGHDLIRYELYLEDTLTNSWRRNLDRHRLNLGGQRNVGIVRFDGTFTGQWLNQEAGKSSALLGRANISFDKSAENLHSTASYALSEERRNARGFSYLQVDPGKGTYRLENGNYIPDPFGNYIRLEELLSDQQRVSRGERSFQVSKELDQAVIRLNSSITEELLPEGHRQVAWVIPFVTDESQPFLFYERRYSADIRIIKLQSVHLINLTSADNREQRRIADQPRTRTDSRYRLALREPIYRWSLEQGIEWFLASRDILYGDAGRSRGWRINAGINRTMKSGELMTELAFRRAEGNALERSRLFVSHSMCRISLPKRGEIRLDTEGYVQTLTGLTGIASTVLTDNHEGRRGVNWTLSFNMGLSASVRANAALNGRYADSRPGQLFARTEVIAEF